MGTKTILLRRDELYLKCEKIYFFLNLDMGWGGSVFFPIQLSRSCTRFYLMT